ncbi:MAG: hypothetical protein ACR2JX_07545 [Mycobacteriales bacterium]
MTAALARAGSYVKSLTLLSVSWATSGLSHEQRALAAGESVAAAAEAEFCPTEVSP